MSSTSHSKNNSKNLQKFFNTYSEITLNDYAQLTDLDQKAQTKNLTTIVHFYDEEEFLCDIVDDCLSNLSTRFTTSNFDLASNSEKYIFVKIRAIDMAVLSTNFLNSGVPAIQILKNFESIGAGVKPDLVDCIGEDFTTEDFLRWLREIGKGLIF